MDIASVSQLISTVGFPIACVCAMFWMWDKERESHKVEMDKVTEAVNNSTFALTEAVNNNTLALTKLEEHLKHE